MGTHLIDTNSVIEFLGGTLPKTGSQWIQSLIDNNLHYLSVINRIELLSYNGTASEMKTLEDFIGSSSIIPLTEEVILRTIQLRRQLKIKLPDAIIASTALVYQLELITRNTEDFKNIPNLTAINPHLK